MDLQKLIKKKDKAVSEDNKLNIATASNKLGNWYNTHGNYQDALEEYKCEAKAYSKLGMKLETAKANRMISEMYMLLTDFSAALKHEEIHLGIARDLGNKIEEQRALATVGRIHLLHGQSVIETNIVKQQLKLAEKAFMKSLLLCENLKGQVPSYELMDMRARLLLNLGVVLEHLENFDRSVEFMDKAIEICSKQDLFELLHQCYVTKGLLLHQKQQDFPKAISYFNKSLDVAERLPDKISKTCESLSMKAEVLVSQYDLQSAKQVLIKAWKLKCLDENEKKNIEKKLKVVSCMCYTEDALISTKTTNYEMRKRLNEKMGDGYCYFKNYSKAITYYLNMLECAKLNNEDEKKLVPIYISLYQTYRDNQQYDEALKYYWKEFDLCSHIPREAFNTLINISEVLELANKQYDIIESVYIKARQQAKKLGRASLEMLCMKKLINLKRLFNKVSEANDLEKELDNFQKEIDISDSSDSENSEISGKTPSIGDEICIEDLSDISENEVQEENNPLHRTRRRNKSIVKRNNKGETQLHTACISGNAILVQRLLNQKHPVNIRDHAGWLPLHEACLHGHTEIVEMLLDNGASINDRGGTNCDGITPLSDAAGNGHLEVIELLLDRGASAKLLTDEGRSALDILASWKETVSLNKTESSLYQSVYNKLKRASMNESDVLLGGQTCETSKSIKNNSPKNHSDSKPRLSNENPLGRLRYEVDDFNDLINDCRIDDDVYTKPVNNTTTKLNKRRSVELDACMEYKNVMKNLRNQSTEIADDKSHSSKEKKKSAFLESHEVGDDWLEDDLQSFKTKKRKFSSNHYFMDPREGSSSNKIHSDESCDSLAELSSDLTDNLNSKNRKKRRKNQSSLLDSGFTRKRSESPNFNTIEKRTIDITNSNQKPVDPPLPPVTTQIGISNFNVVPPIPVKVRIEDRLLVVPIMSHLIDSLDIAWLSKEAAKRYYNLVGIEPSIILMLPDGALLSQDDPLSLVLGVSELKSQVVKWVLLPLQDRYLEACSQLNCVVDSSLQTALNVCEATQVLDLPGLGLTHSQIQPVLRSLNHQNNVQVLNLSGNVITNEGVKQLCSTLQNMSQIKELNLSSNNLTFKTLCYLSELCDKISLVKLEEINVGFNPLGDESWKYLAIILNKLSLKKLMIPSCELQQMNQILLLNMQNIIYLDISCNELDYYSFTNILANINGDLLEHLNLSFIRMVDTLLFSKLIEFFNNCSLKNLNELNMSGCDIGDTGLSEILHSLLRTNSLQTFVLKHNFNLSSISFRRLLQHRPSIRNINLDGCVNITKYLSISNVYDDCDDIIPQNISLTIDKSTADGQMKLDIIKNMWLKMWGDRAEIKFGPFGLINLSIITS